MANNKPRPLAPEKQLSIFGGMINQLRLVWLLLQDNRVSVWAKSVVPLSLLYLISPIDFVPDVILGLGQLDDLTVILLGMALFVKLCPPELVEHYLNQIEFGGSSFSDDETIDATYRVVDEE